VTEVCRPRRRAYILWKELFKEEVYYNAVYRRIDKEIIMKKNC
jgi:hypothetical protein